MTVCIASDTALVSYRIRERPLVRRKIPVKSASRFRARRLPTDRRKTFREVLNTCFYVLTALQDQQLHPVHRLLLTGSTAV